MALTTIITLYFLLVIMLIGVSLVARYIDFLLGLLATITLASCGIYLGTMIENNHYDITKKITECEITLTRDQSCQIVAIPVPPVEVEKK